MPIKAISFDFWSTLYRSKAVDYVKRMRFLKETLEEGSGVLLTYEQVEAAVKVARMTWSRVWMEEQRTLNANKWLAIMLGQLNIRLDAAYLAEIEAEMENSVLNDLPTMAPEVEATLADLSTRYRLAIISDTGLTPGRVLRQLLAQDNLLHYFTHLTFSDEVGRSKPHPTVFLTTLKALNVSPAEAVHVGDLLRTDIAGAQRAGLWAVQYTGISHDPVDSREDKSGVIPDAVIQRHSELRPLLEKW